MTCENEIFNDKMLTNQILKIISFIQPFRVSWEGGFG